MGAQLHHQIHLQFCLSQYYLLYTYISHMFSLFKCNFDSLEWQFGTWLFYVDLETSSKMKLICVPTHYYCCIPFSAVNSIFLNFSHVCQIYVAGVLIIHFCRYCHLRCLSPYEYQSEVNFGGSTPSPDSYLCCTFSGSTQSLVPVPYMSHIRWRGVSSMSSFTSIQPELIWGEGVNSISGSISRFIFMFYLLRVHSISGSRPMFVSLRWRGVNSMSGSISSSTTIQPELIV